MTQKERIDLLHWCLKEAKKQGADEVSAILSKNRQSAFEIRNGDVDLLEGADQTSLSLALFIDERYSVNQTSILRKSSLSGFIRHAAELTRQINRDPFRRLPDPKQYWQGPGRDLNISDPAIHTLEPAQKREIPMQLERMVRKKKREVVSVTTSYSDSFSQMIRISSNGFEGEREGTSFSVGSEVVVRGKRDDLPSDWFYSYTRHFNDIPELDLIADKSLNYALAKIGQKKIESGRYDMIVMNRSASRLVGMILSAMTGSKLWNKSTFLEGKLDQKIFSDKLTLIDDPTIPKGLGSLHFDSDGFELNREVLVDRGILKRFFINQYFSRKLNRPVTTSSSTNVLMLEGNRDSEAMLRSMTAGIHVTGFLGGNFNSTTGDFSLGVTGELVRNGQRIHPVNEMNITGNVKTLFENLDEVGNDPYSYSSYRLPTLLFKDVSFSGI